MTLDRYRISILVDVKQRDLPGYALLKETLETRYPCSVALYPAGRDRSVALSFQPHLTVLSSVNSPQQIQWAFFLKSRGVLVAFVPTEGVPVLLEEDFLDYMAGRHADLRPVDLHLVWNQDIHDRSVRNGWLRPERVELIGVPRFDFYHSAFRDLRPSREAFCRGYGLDPREPIVTWTTNYGGTSLTPEQHLRGARLHKLDQVRALRDPVRYLENEIDSRELARERVTRWCLTHPDANVVVRPHPSEKRDYYEAVVADLAAKGRPRVVTASREPIWDVLAATDVLAQRCCTTGVEGCIMRLPVIEMQFNPDEINTNPLRDAGMDVVRTYEELEGALDHYLAGGKIPSEQEQARERFIETWFHRIDGKRTAACADALWRLVQLSPGDPRFSANERRLGRAASVWREIQRVTGLQPSHIHRRPDTYITPADVRAWSVRIRASGVLEAHS